MPDFPDFTSAIDILSQSQALLSPAEWAVMAGTDINMWAGGANIEPWGTLLFSYAVPAGKTLYVFSAEFSLCAYTLSERDLQTLGMAMITANGGNGYWAHFGGNGGGLASNRIPLAIPGGSLLQYTVFNASAHYTIMRAMLAGYLV